MSAEQKTVLGVALAMRHGVIPPHRHDRELLNFFADQLMEARKYETEVGGNTAKLREAVVALIPVAEHGLNARTHSLNCTVGATNVEAARALVEQAKKAIADAKDALAIPPRNCAASRSETISSTASAPSAAASQIM